MSEPRTYKFKDLRGNTNCIDLQGLECVTWYPDEVKNEVTIELMYKRDHGNYRLMFIVLESVAIGLQSAFQKYMDNK